VTADELSAAIEGTDVPALLESLGFRVEFVADKVLTTPGSVTVSQVAMLWMGMPNKHDRKRTRQLLEALADAGLLVRAGEDTYEAGTR
jgi:hypothetical protein